MEYFSQGDPRQELPRAADAREITTPQRMTPGSEHCKRAIENGSEEGASQREAGEDRAGV